jgi:hypothetical protein
MSTATVTGLTGDAWRGMLMLVRGTSVIPKGRPVMGKELSTDTAAAARHERFGRLPERIRFEDMAEETEAAPRGGVNTYTPEGSWKYYSCLALDLGL